MTCATCQGTIGVTVHTYKHAWWTCSRCGTTARTRRDRYPLAILRSQVGRVAPQTVVDMLYPAVDVIADERHFYDYYRDASGQAVAETRWAAQIDAITTRLRDHGIEWQGRDVLDISGGPGFVTKHLAA